jgi:hypothetical protein
MSNGVVCLTWPELLLGCYVGVMRRVNALRRARQEPYGERPQASWNDDINGALAELAVAKHFNVFWSGTVGRVDLPDVGPLQVRSKNQADHRLVILKTDADDKLFISVFVATPECRLCGWFRAGDAKQAEWLLPDPPKPDRYFVPNSELHSIDTLQFNRTASDAIRDGTQFEFVTGQQ